MEEARPATGVHMHRLGDKSWWRGPEWLWRTRRTGLWTVYAPAASEQGAAMHASTHVRVCDLPAPCVVWSRAAAAMMPYYIETGHSQLDGVSCLTRCRQNLGICGRGVPARVCAYGARCDVFLCMCIHMRPVPCGCCGLTPQGVVRLSATRARQHLLHVKTLNA